MAQTAIECGIPVNVCRLVKCETCGKTTWAGCGLHAEAVMESVKEEDKIEEMNSPLVAPFDPDDVVTTDSLDAYMDARGPMLNNYTRHAKIGDGHHGEVYLCYQLNTKLPEGHADRRVPVAMKSVKRDNPRAKQFRKLRQQRLPTNAHTQLVDRLGTTETKIRKEIAIMKKCRHPHVVRLYEVIDDRSKEKIYMVMEYLAGGEVRWTNDDKPILTYDQTRRIIRDAVLGLEYLHHQGIIHRDIKPANLLYTQDRCQVKIADFGVSHFSYAQRLASAGAGEDTDDVLLDDSDLTKRAGTPSFLAPEIVYEHTYDPSSSSSSFSPSSPSPSRSPSSQSTPSSAHPPRPPITKSIDIWALGVTLYCLLFGKTPFAADPAAAGTEWSLYNAICNLDWAVEETMCADHLPTGGRRPRGKDARTRGGMVVCLLERLLMKDPGVRITLDEVKHHDWLLQDIPEPTSWLKLTMPKGKINVSASETSDAMSAIRFQWNWNSVARRVSSLFRRREGQHHHKDKHKDRDKGKHKDRDKDKQKDRGRDGKERGGVLSDPQGGRIKLRRHQSARMPDDLGYSSSQKEKGKQRERDASEGAGQGETLSIPRPRPRPKSMGPWLLTGGGQGSKSTSAIPSPTNTSAMHMHGGAGTASADTSADTSPTTTTTATTTPTPTPTTHTTTTVNEKPRARFNFFSIKHWKPSPSATPSSSSPSPYASPPTFSRSNTGGTITMTRRSEEVLRYYHPASGGAGALGDFNDGEERLITAERRASSWGMGDGGGLSAASSYDFLMRPVGAGGLLSPGPGPGSGGSSGSGRSGSGSGSGGSGVGPGSGLGSGSGGGAGGTGGAVQAHMDQRFAPRTPSRLSTLATVEGETGEGGRAVGVAVVGRRTSDRFGPAYYDEDSSTIASGEGRWGSGSGSGSGSLGESGEDEDEEDEDEDEEDEDEDEDVSDEDEGEDEDEDEDEGEDGVVFAPRKRPPQDPDDT